MKITVIGAGLGGLSAACLLANNGHEVTVFEKNDRPGGKIGEIQAHGFRFDTGPSLLTMPKVLKTLFERCGASVNDYLTLQPVDPICRYFFSDKTIFDCFQQRSKSLKEIKKIAPEDVQHYADFLEYSSNLYNHTKNAFLFNPLYNLKDAHRVKLLDFLKIDAFSTVAKRVDEYFESSYLRQFFKRFSTYNGSSPFKAPATLNVIPHVELNIGGYYIKGGIYQLIKSLTALGPTLGVAFRYNTEVISININQKKVTGFTAKNGQSYPADLVISNSDAHTTFLDLLPQNEVSYSKKKLLQVAEPSCSGFVLLLGINRKYEQLRHHTIFFCDDYRTEFRQIFEDKVMPSDPTIYIANTSSSDPDHAVPGGSNLFIMVNAPYLSEQWNWNHQEKSYAGRIIHALEARGLTELKKSIVYQNQITPVDFYQRYRSYKGSIYGTSSNSRAAAFLRPKNKARNIKGLYLVGGSTHPGGGIPLVILSAFNAVKLIERYEH